MKINKTLIGAETFGATMNIIYAKRMFREGHRNKAYKALEEAQRSIDFIQWHIQGKRK